MPPPMPRRKSPASTMRLCRQSITGKSTPRAFPVRARHTANDYGQETTKFKKELCSCLRTIRMAYAFTLVQLQAKWFDPCFMAFVGGIPALWTELQQVQN